MSTLGEKRVRTDFNVTSDNLVDAFKRSSAELINLCETINEVNKKNGYVTSKEQKRLIKYAQKHYESAAMWAVKAATINY
jgi:hypothetical protein